MRSQKLYEAFSYVDDWFLDIADAPAKDTSTTRPHSFRRITTIALAAALTVSLLAATALATGWIPGFFAALQERYPQDAELFEAAAEANTDAVPEIVEIPQLELSKLVMLERYFDGETILLGYDLEKVLPEPVVGFEPDEELLAKIKRANRSSTIDWAGYDPGEKNLNTKKAEQYNLTADAFAIDQAMQGSLSEEEYKKAWRILEDKGWVCVAVRDVWIGDTILIDGQDLREVYNSETNAYSSRTEYESELGNCIRLEPLPDDVKAKERVMVTLTAKTNVEYWYLDLNGNGRTYFDPDSVESEQISFELERTEKHD